jgi:hypothetical protein
MQLLHEDLLKLSEADATKESEVSQKIDTFVEKGDVTEQSILDQLDDIHSCF